MSNVYFKAQSQTSASIFKLYFKLQLNSNFKCPVSSFRYIASSDKLGTAKYAKFHKREPGDMVTTGAAERS